MRPLLLRSLSSLLKSCQHKMQGTFSPGWGSFADPCNGTLPPICGVVQTLSSDSPGLLEKPCDTEDLLACCGLSSPGCSVCHLPGLQSPTLALHPQECDHTLAQRQDLAGTQCLLSRPMGRTWLTCPP